MKKRIRIAQIGVCHEHASGKINTLKRLPEYFEIAGHKGGYRSAGVGGGITGLGGHILLLDDVLKEMNK